MPERMARSPGPHSGVAPPEPHVHPDRAAERAGPGPVSGVRRTREAPTCLFSLLGVPVRSCFCPLRPSVQDATDRPDCPDRQEAPWWPGSRAAALSLGSSGLCSRGVLCPREPGECSFHPSEVAAWWHSEDTVSQRPCSMMEAPAASMAPSPETARWTDRVGRAPALSQSCRLLQEVPSTAATHVRPPSG